MQHVAPGETYRKRLSKLEILISGLSRRINLLSLARLALLILSIYSLIRGLALNLAWLYLLTALSFLAFLVLVIVFNRQKSKRELQRKIRELNQQELRCLDHEFGELPDGARFADSEHPWSHDLDLFGPGSLFQYLNRCGSAHGENTLAAMLSSAPEDAEQVGKRQELIRDLAPRVAFRQEFTARGRLLDATEDVIDDLEEWSRSESYISRHPWLYYLALVITVCSTGVFIAALFDGSRFWWLLYILFLNFGILSFFMMRTNQYQRSISKKTGLLQSYAGRMRCIQEEGFAHPEWIRAREIAREGTRQTARLSRLLGMFDQRMNMLMGIVLNGLFLYDFHMLHHLERWKRRNGDKIMAWIRLVNHMDAMNSLGGFAFNHPEFTFPTFTGSSPGDTEPGNTTPAASEPGHGEAEPLTSSSEPGLAGPSGSLEISALGHPLIPGGRRVDNDLALKDEKIVVITGANMAGKSTFLRAVGVNLVLAYTGCPVCATRFSMPFGELYSSMRTADSLKDDESYFLAEIKRLGKIVSQMEQGRPMLILLDEVLKGTNTTDKKLGSIGLIEKALAYPVHCLIATHDLSLGDLEKQHPEVVNHCFESYIKDMELSFDYTIRKGIATNMNASFLMRKMGIMD